MSLRIHVKRVLMSDGWQHDKTLVIDQGVISAIESGDIDASEHYQTMIPGMINCHSHAFQRAFAGFSEQGSEGQDSFWTWRKVMYDFLAKLSIEDAGVIASQLYVEMLKQGYTRVAEFHYLHHDITGPSEDGAMRMAEEIMNSADKTGLGLTLLPVLYQYSGFGAQQPNIGQQRFIHSVDGFNQLVSHCANVAKAKSNINVGIAPHSLRAVDKTSLQSAVNHLHAMDNNAPVHIHIAEQQKEVNDCIEHYGQRPVEWLLDNFELDSRWCLIHATHINEHEISGIAQSGAVAGICPTTEANLGDGVFPTVEFMTQKGAIAIGSDSHISVNPVEELRWLEYAQRLVKQQRALLADSDTVSVGQYLWQEANKGGASSTSHNSGEIALGNQADFIVLDEQLLRHFANDDKHLMDSLIFASQGNAIQHVMVNGIWHVRDGQHKLEQEISQAYLDLMERLA